MPRTDEAGAREHEDVERLAIEPPAHHRDQRDAQEVERDHQGGVAGPECIGQAVMRRQPGDAEPRQRRQLMQAELGGEQRVGADRARAAAG